MSNEITFKKLVLDKRLRLSPVAYYCRGFSDDFYMDFHRHTYIEFMYCVSDSFTVLFIDNKKSTRTTVEINEGEFIFISTNKKHKLLIEKGKNPVIANIEFAVLKDNDDSPEKCIDYSQFFVTYLSNLYLTENDFIVLKDNHLVRENLVRLVTFLDEDRDKDYIRQSMNIMSFFYSIRESMEKGREGKYYFIRSAVQYIYENISRPLSIKEVAGYVNKSESYFAHKFKEDRGISVLKYINNVRIDKARFLLKNTSLSINEIAKEVGYKNKGQLEYQFQINIKCTPSEYKRKILHKQIDNRMILSSYRSIDFK